MTIFRATLLAACSILFLAAPRARAGGGREQSGVEEEPAARFVRLMNLGVAHLENRSAAPAAASFTAALALDPASGPARRNLARAELLAGREEDAARALEVLTAAPPGAPASAATAYLSGLACARRSRFAEAVPYFQQAVRLDPAVAALRFQLAAALQALDRHGEALVQLRQTIRLDPMHATAFFRLANAARREGDAAGFAANMRQFMRLRRLFGDETRSPRALEACRYSRPETVAAAGARPGPAPIPVRYTDATAEIFAGPGATAAAGAAVLEVTGDGRAVVFVAGTAGHGDLLTLAPAGAMVFSAQTDLPALARPLTACLAGDFHDPVPEGVKPDPVLHARNDLLLIAPGFARLLERSAAGGFADVTGPSGLRGLAGARARWLDFEHDGDLDLAVAGGEGLKIWQNNGDGTFAPVTETIGIPPTGPATDVAAADLDADHAIDVVVARGEKPTLVFENQRAGRFAPMPEPPGPWPPARRVVLADLGGSGRPDAVLLSEREAVILYTAPAARSRIALPDLDAAGVVAVDYDNDGGQDLCFFGGDRAAADRGRLSLWRNRGAASWSETSAATGLAALELPAVQAVVPADLDGDGDDDLLLVTAGRRLVLLRNDGGNANHRLALRLRTVKTNPSGLGTRVEVRRGRFRASRTVLRVPIAIGVGPRARLDSVQTIWTNGVVQNLIDVEVATPAPIDVREKNVAAGSCPFLYAWDGRGHRFVTDLLGNAPLGLSVRRGVVLPADPDEMVSIGPASALAPRGGGYEVVVTDEFRELLYLDAVALVAVDHRPDLEIHPTDRIMAPPFPPSEPWALRRTARLVQASGDDGRDRTAALRAIDGTFAPPGAPLPPPLRGMCRPLALTFRFDRLPTTGPLVLALTGWLQYGDASTNIAMSQNAGLEIIPPALEVETAGGRWRAVDTVVGMPAGKTKTIVCDLAGRLPAGARQLRLTTTFEIRWDRIALCERVPLDPAAVRTLPPLSARLAWRGFSPLLVRAPGHPTTPMFETVTDRPPWRTTPEGWCTGYGDVRDLLARRDGRLVILNGGDALTLRFDAAALPPVPDGRRRSFLFFSVGWDKDEDHNVLGGARVLPLPGAAPGAAFTAPTAGDWRLRANTRWVPRDRFRPEDENGR